MGSEQLNILVNRAHLARLASAYEGEEDPELTVIYVRDGITHPP